MKVIVAGMSKTGTTTMNAALTELGYEVYDLMENFWYVGDGWMKQFKEGFRVEDMKRMYENVDAVVNTPCDKYWEEIFEAFPDSKVILTTRDEDSWFKSLTNQIDRMNSDVTFRLVRTFTYTGIRFQTYFSRSERHLANIGTWPFSNYYLKHEESLKRFKRKHEQNVTEVVPKNQLLIYQVTEGWKPLCDFLDVPVRNEPFPHKNKGGVALDEMRKEKAVMQRLENELWIFFACMLVLLVALLYNMHQYMV